ncbi:unnamed protein product, partial [Polarella glacialis]
VKSALEGQQLTAYVVSVIGRIMVDFSRFADVVLRWQRKSAGADDKVTFGQIPEKLPAEGTDSVWFREMVDRLERQDKQNTELESKYSGVANELRERKRQFLRERSIWKERLRNLQAHARESGDRALDKLLYHDVQFYAEVGERSVEDVQDEYERKLVEQELKFQEEILDKNHLILDLEKDVEQLQTTLAAARGRRSSSSDLEKRMARAEMACEGAEEAREKIEQALRALREECEALKVANDGLLMQ